MRICLFCLTIAWYVSIQVSPVRAYTIVAPNELADVEGPRATVAPFRGRGDGSRDDATFQWILSASNFSAITPGSKITSIGFRLNGERDTSPSSQLEFSQWDLQLSTVDNPTLSLSTAFADNQGDDVVTVRSGALSIPLGSFSGGTSPNDFFDIPFTTPFVYESGELVLTVEYREHSGAQAAIFLDADDTENGRGNSNGTIFNGPTGVTDIFHFPIIRIQVIPEPTTGYLALAAVSVLFARRNS